jgi:hypothetical protein
MNYIVVLRNPDNRKVLCLNDEDGEVAMFESYGEALRLARDHLLCGAWGYQIVELEV